MIHIQIDRTFFAVSAFASMLFIVFSLPFSISHIDGCIISMFAMILILLPFIIPNKILDGGNE